MDHGYPSFGRGAGALGSAWGAEVEEEGGNLATYAPLITAVVEGISDPHQQAMLWEQRLITLQSMGFSESSSVYRSALARYEAALRSAGLETEDEESTREWRSLGKAGVATGIVLGIGVLIAIGVVVGRRK